jgi:hypothetical protein
MNYDDLRCPKCDAPMERGFTVDLKPQLPFTGDYATKWQRGPAINAPLRLRAPAGSHPIATFRCTKCGYLESYASPEFASTRQFSLRALFVVVTIIAVGLGIVVTLARFFR